MYYYFIEQQVIENKKKKNIFLKNGRQTRAQLS